MLHRQVDHVLLGSLVTVLIQKTENIDSFGCFHYKKQWLKKQSV